MLELGIKTTKIRYLRATISSLPFFFKFFFFFKNFIQGYFTYIILTLHFPRQTPPVFLFHSFSKHITFLLYLLLLHTHAKNPFSVDHMYIFSVLTTWDYWMTYTSWGMSLENIDLSQKQLIAYPFEDR